MAHVQALESLSNVEAHNHRITPFLCHVDSLGDHFTRRYEATPQKAAYDENTRDG